MSLVFLPLIIALGICLLPIWLLPRRNFQRPRDYFIASQPTPPDVMRNSAVAYPLRIAAFGPLFVWGASGDLWPALIGAACCGLGVYLIYALRRPLLASLDDALSGDASATVPALIAKWYGNDDRVRLLTASLTVVALTGLITAEAFAAATLVQPILMESAGSVYLLAGGMLVLTLLYTIFAGNSGVMHTVQLQVGMIYLALFGSTALLLYFLVSDGNTMPPHGSFAVLFSGAACCLHSALSALQIRRQHPDQENGWAHQRCRRWRAPLIAFSPAARLEKALDTFVSVFVILVIVLIVMEFSAFGVAGMARDSIAALQAGTGMSGTALADRRPRAVALSHCRCCNLAKVCGAWEGHRLRFGPAVCHRSQNLQFACRRGHAVVAGHVHVRRHCGHCDRNTSGSRRTADVHSPAGLGRKSACQSCHIPADCRHICHVFIGNELHALGELVGFALRPAAGALAASLRRRE